VHKSVYLCFTVLNPDPKVRCGGKVYNTFLFFCLPLPLQINECLIFHNNPPLSTVIIIIIIIIIIIHFLILNMPSQQPDAYIHEKHNIQLQITKDNTQDTNETDTDKTNRRVIK
jgi:hypothetical protein